MKLEEFYNQELLELKKKSVQKLSGKGKKSGGHKAVRLSGTDRIDKKLERHARHDKRATLEALDDTE